MKKLSIALLFASIHMTQAYVLNDFTNAVQAAKANKSDANIRKVLEILDDLTKKRNVSSAQIQRLQELGLGEYANVSNRLETYNLRRGTSAQAEQLAGKDAQLAAQQQDLLNKQIDALRLRTEVEQLRGDFLGAVGNLRRLKNEFAETLEENNILNQADFAKFQQEKKAEIDQLKTDLQQAQQDAQALINNPNLDQQTKDSIVKLQQQVKDRIKENLEQSNKISQLSEIIKQLQQEKADSTQDLQAARKTITDIEKDFSTVKSEYSKAINQIAALQNQITDSDDKKGLADLKKQLDEQKSAFDAEISRLKAEIAEAEKSLVAARSGEELQNARNAVVLLEGRVADLSQKKEALEEALEKAKQFKSPDVAKDTLAQKIKEFIDQGSDFTALSKQMGALSAKVGYLPVAANLVNENNGIIGKLRKLYDDVTKEVSPFEQLKKINEFEALRNTFNANADAIQSLDNQVRARLAEKINENKLYKESIASLIFSDKALATLKANVLKKIDDLENSVNKLSGSSITSKEYQSLVDDFDYVKENSRSLRTFDEASLLIDQANKLFAGIDDLQKLLPGWFTRSPLSAATQKGVNNLIQEKADIKPQIDALIQLVNTQKGKKIPVLGDINAKLRDGFASLIRLADLYDIVAENVAVERAKQISNAPLALPAPETKAPESKPNQPANGNQYLASVKTQADVEKVVEDLLALVLADPNQAANEVAKLEEAVQKNSIAINDIVKGNFDLIKNWNA